MGGDGGTLAVKRAYLQRSEDSQGTAEAESHRDAELRRERYTHCAASGEVLKAPVVCCPLGLLYNKEAILLKLLQGLPPELEHVRRKELIPCELTNNPKYVEEGAGTAAVSVTDSTSDQLLATAPFICPVTGLEMNGTSLFCVLIPSGRVLSEKAINQVPELLHESESLVYLNPDETRRKKVLEELKRKRKQAKKEKKNDHSSKLASGPSLSSSSSSSFPSVGEGVEDLKSSQRKQPRVKGVGGKVVAMRGEKQVVRLQGKKELEPNKPHFLLGSSIVEMAHSKLHFSSHLTSFHSISHNRSN